MDSYTVKKIVPRLLIAAILINLSIYIVALAVDITNIIGAGLYGLITSPLTSTGTFKFAVNGFGGDVSFVALVGAGLLLLSMGAELIMFLLFFILVPGVLAMLGVLFTLVLRRAIIIALIITSPIAFALWCLPNTEPLFRRWMNLLFRTLMVYPLVMLIFAVSSVLAVTIEGGGTPSFLTQIVAMVATIMPLFLVPFAFRMAGGVMAVAANAVNNVRQRASRPSQKLGTTRAKLGYQKQWKRTVSGHAFKGGVERDKDGNFAADSKWHQRLRGRANARLHTGAIVMSGQAGFDPRTMRARIAGAKSSHPLEHLDALLNDPKFLAKGPKDDDVAFALMLGGTMAQRRAALLELDRQKIETKRANGDPAPEGNYIRADSSINNDELDRVLGKTQSIMMDPNMDQETVRQAAFIRAMQGGTVFKDADVWDYAGRVAGNDDGLLKDLVARGREAGMSAGRVDEAGAGHGDTFMVAKRSRDGWVGDGTLGSIRGRQYTPEEYRTEFADRQLRQAVIKAQGVGILLHPSMKPRSMENLAPEIMAQLEEAFRSGDQDLIDRQLADINNVYEGLRQTSPQLADQFEKLVMGAGITTANLNPNQIDTFDDLIVDRGRPQTRQVTVDLTGTDPNTGTRYINPATGGYYAAGTTETRNDFVPGTVELDATGRPTGRGIPTGHINGGFTVWQALENRKPRSRPFRERTPVYQNFEDEASRRGPAPGPGGPGGPPLGLGGPPSDRRLKHHITHISTTPDGIKLYSFKYLWSNQIYIGVMAQDLLGTEHEHAVIITKSGYYAVNYNALGIEMMTYEQWQAKRYAKV